MKKAVIAFVALIVIASAAPAQAQLGGLGKLKKLGDKAVDTKSKVDDLTFSEEEERQIGEQVSLKLRERFGVYQDEAVTKYVSLVGSAIAQAGTRPTLEWKFIVLDTDGVNAYAAPGGLIHVTRGLLGLLKSEAELAGVLGHEITHVTARHTLEAIRRGKITTEASSAAGGGSLRNQIIARAVGFSYEHIFDGAYSRGDENESDKVGVQVANRVGYAAHGLAGALQKIADRNASRSEPNGFFVSHPVIKDRIASIEKVINADRLAAKATVDARYRQFITFDARPITEIAADVEDAAGLASGGKKKDDEKDARKEEPKKSRFGGIASITGGKQAASTQQTASAGARGATPDRDAKGGPNRNALGVKVTAAELEAFKKGIAS
jgi:predicted Zn-dependent protease